MAQPKVFYRNSHEIILPNGEIIDQGSLWELRNNEMVLVDDDQYVTYATYPHDPDFKIDL